MTVPATKNLLSERLAGVVPSAFFRPLARPSAPVYIDCADRLAESADEGGQVSHADTLTLIREVLAAHPQVQLADDEGATMTDLRQRAQRCGKILEIGNMICGQFPQHPQQATHVRCQQHPAFIQTNVPLLQPASFQKLVVELRQSAIRRSRRIGRSGSRNETTCPCWILAVALCLCFAGAWLLWRPMNCKRA